jgi:hypothetical protein
LIIVLEYAFLELLNGHAVDFLVALAIHEIEWPVFAHICLVMPLDTLDCLIVSLTNALIFTKDAAVEGLGEYLLSFVADRSLGADNMWDAGLEENFTMLL